MAIPTKTEYDYQTQSRYANSSHANVFIVSHSITIQSDAKYAFCAFAHQEIMRRGSVKRAFLVVGNTQTGA